MSATINKMKRRLRGLDNVIDRGLLAGTDERRHGKRLVRELQDLAHAASIEYHHLYHAEELAQVAEDAGRLNQKLTDAVALLEECVPILGTVRWDEAESLKNRVRCFLTQAEMIDPRMGPGVGVSSSRRESDNQRVGHAEG